MTEFAISKHLKIIIIIYSRDINTNMANNPIEICPPIKHEKHFVVQRPKNGKNSLTQTQSSTPKKMTTYNPGMPLKIYKLNWLLN